MYGMHGMPQLLHNLCRLYGNVWSMHVLLYEMIIFLCLDLISYCEFLNTKKILKIEFYIQGSLDEIEYLNLDSHHKRCLIFSKLCILILKIQQQMSQNHHPPQYILHFPHQSTKPYQIQKKIQKSLCYQQQRHLNFRYQYGKKNILFYNINFYQQKMNQNTTYAYGQTSGNGSYKAPSMYQNKGPKVAAGGDRYDNYGNNGNNNYPQEKQGMSGCEKCCACLGGLACCCIICDCLT